MHLVIYIYICEKRPHASRARRAAICFLSHLGPRRLDGAMNESAPRFHAASSCHETNLGRINFGTLRIRRLECLKHKRPSTDRNARSQALSPGLWCHRRRNRGVGECTTVIGKAETIWCGHEAGVCCHCGPTASKWEGVHTVGQPSE